MGAQTRNVTVATCDSQKCNVQHVSAVDGEAEAKFDRRGTLTVDHPTGALSVDWLACKPAHVKGAVESAHARALAQAGGGEDDEDGGGSRVEV